MGLIHRSSPRENSDWGISLFCRRVTGRQPAQRGIIRIETNGVLWTLFRRPQRVCPLACGFYLFPKTIQILIPVVSGKIYALRYRRFGSTKGR